MAEGSENSERQEPIVDVERPTPTRASKTFLERTGQSIKKRWTNLLPFAATLAVVSGYVGSQSVASDVVQGDFKNLAVKGIIMAASFAPMALKAKGIIK